MLGLEHIPSYRLAISDAKIELEKIADQFHAAAIIGNKKLTELLHLLEVNTTSAPEVLSKTTLGELLRLAETDAILFFDDSLSSSKKYQALSTILDELMLAIKAVYESKTKPISSLMPSLGDRATALNILNTYLLWQTTIKFEISSNEMHLAKENGSLKLSNVKEAFQKNFNEYLSILTSDQSTVANIILSGQIQHINTLLYRLRHNEDNLLAQIESLNTLEQQKMAEYYQLTTAVLLRDKTRAKSKIEHITIKMTEIRKLKIQHEVQLAELTAKIDKVSHERLALLAKMHQNLYAMAISHSKEFATIKISPATLKPIEHALSAPTSKEAPKASAGAGDVSTSSSTRDELASSDTTAEPTHLLPPLIKLVRSLLATIQKEFKKIANQYLAIAIFDKEELIEAMTSLGFTDLLSDERLSTLTYNEFLSIAWPEAHINGSGQPDFERRQRLIDLCIRLEKNIKKVKIGKEDKSILKPLLQNPAIAAHIVQLYTIYDVLSQIEPICLKFFDSHKKRELDEPHRFADYCYRMEENVKSLLEIDSPIANLIKYYQTLNLNAQCIDKDSQIRSKYLQIQLYQDKLKQLDADHYQNTTIALTREPSSSKAHLEMGNMVSALINGELIKLEKEVAELSTELNELKASRSQLFNSMKKNMEYWMEQFPERVGRLNTDSATDTPPVSAHPTTTVDQYVADREATRTTPTPPPTTPLTSTFTATASSDDSSHQQIPLVAMWTPPVVLAEAFAHPPTNTYSMIEAPKPMYMLAAFNEVIDTHPTGLAASRTKSDEHTPSPTHTAPLTYALAFASPPERPKCARHEGKTSPTVGT